MTLHSTDPTLYALFCLRRDTLPAHTGTLGRLTGRSASQTALDLLQLESLGLVDATNVRLTILGLARSAQLAHVIGDRQRSADRQALSARPRRRSLQRIKQPVAAGGHSARYAHQAQEAEDQAVRVPKALSA
jgi:hypothetical protein